jgi:hypothetical protein
MKTSAQTPSNVEEAQLAEQLGKRIRIQKAQMGRKDAKTKPKK